MNLERLEARQLLTTGPELVAVRPNTGGFLSQDDVLNEGPRELVLQFSPGQQIDPTTLQAGIHVTRAGLDAQFTPASASSDFNTDDAVLIRFDSVRLGDTGNGVTLDISQLDFGDDRAPQIRVDRSQINVTLNATPGDETTARQLVETINSDPLSNSLVRATLVRGAGTTDITTPSQRQASVTTDLGSAGASQLTITAVQSGEAGNGIEVEIIPTPNLFGGRPVVSVLPGRLEIQVESATGPTDVGDIETQINAFASSLVTATSSGGDVTPPAESLTLSGARDVSTDLTLRGAGAAAVLQDFGGLAGIQFTADTPGPTGNDILVEFTAADRGANGGVGISVDTVKSIISIELNSAAAASTTARELVNAVNADPVAGALVDAALVTGDPGADVAATVGAGIEAQLSGANDVIIDPGVVLVGENPNEVIVRFKETLPDDDYRLEIFGTATNADVVTDFNTGDQVRVRFFARAAGTLGEGVRVTITKADLGLDVPPLVTTDPDNRLVTIELNTNVDSPTTAQQVLDQLNNDPVANRLVLAEFVEISPNFFGVPVVDVATTADNETLTLTNSFRTPLANSVGDAFNDNRDQSIDFELDLGAKVISLVPQPIDRNSQRIRLAGSPTGGDFTLAYGDEVTAVIDRLASAGDVETALENLESIADVMVTLNGPSDWTVTFLGDLANGRVPLLVGDGGGLTGGVNVSVDVTQVLTQQKDTVHVFFNQDELDPAFATDPRFYTLIDTNATLESEDDQVLIPQTVTYDVERNMAILTFPSDLPEATYRLSIGTSEESNDTFNANANLSEATRLGTLFHFDEGGTTDHSRVGFIGDGANNKQDVDLFEVNLQPGRTLTVDVDAHAAGQEVSLRIFEVNGTQLGTTETGASVQEMVTNATGSLMTVFIGISGMGNEGYDPIAGGGLADGDTGSYLMQLEVNMPGDLGGDDNNSSFETATDLGFLGAAVQQVAADITEQFGLTGIELPQFPGGNNEPGHRHIPPEDHLGPFFPEYVRTEFQGETTSLPEGRDGLNLGQVFDNDPAIQVINYNFQDTYGVDIFTGEILSNGITDNQKQRAREIFELFARYTGVEFRETANSGITVVTGDMRAINETTPVGPGEAFGRFGRTNTGILAAIMDANETDWGSSEFGGKFFKTAMQQIGHGIGLGDAYDIPSIMGDLGDPLLNRPQIGPGGQGLSGNPVEAVFPGDHDIVHAQRLHRPDSTDIDLYKFRLAETGVFEAETTAERLERSSLLNTALRLYRQNPDGSFELVSQNDDYFSTDSFISLTLDPGTYFLGVSSTGNTNYDPHIDNSGFGGTTDGNYQLKLAFAALPSNEAANRNLLDKAPAIAFFDNDVREGDTITVDTDGAGGAAPVVFEFDTDGISQSGTLTNVPVPFGSTASAADLARALGEAINNPLQFDGSVATLDTVASVSGLRVRLTGEPTVATALSNDILDLSVAVNDTDGELFGTQFDGDGDGVPGGKIDFWFQTSDSTLFVDKSQDRLIGPEGTGSETQPFDTISSALHTARYRIIAPLEGGDVGLLDGNTFTIQLGTEEQVFEFNEMGTTTFVDVNLDGSPDNELVEFTAGDSPSDLATAISDAIAMRYSTDPNLNAIASGRIITLSGNAVDAGTAIINLAGTPILLSTPNLVRIVGNSDPTNFPDNARPYLLGLDDAGVPLADGNVFEVPQGTTVMVDEGALFKSQAVVFDAGSSNPAIDRSQGAIQVFGIPDSRVFFRSYHNDDIGGDTDGVVPREQPGDWGGLVFRDNSDLEQEGIFLNWVNHGDINNGGGEVEVDSVRQTFTPIHLIASRPTVSFNTITNSTQAPISADPDSFSDALGRIGPDIHGNLVVDNTVNALFIRIATTAAAVPLDKLNVPARLDDTDIVHVLTENLQIVGGAGGPLVQDEVQRLQIFGNPTGGTFRLQFEDHLGNTMVTSDIAFNAPTTQNTNEVQTVRSTVSTGNVFLRWADPITNRSFGTINVPFNATATELGSQLASLANVNPGELIVTGASLVGGLNVEFAGRYAGLKNIQLIEAPFGGANIFVSSQVVRSVLDHLEDAEFLSSTNDPDDLIRLSEKGEINITHFQRDIRVTGGPLPAVPITIQFVGRYAGENVGGLTIDDDSLTGGNPTTQDITVSQVQEAEIFARPGGRLRIDPGIIVKLEGARIEAEVGSSQVIAEGTEQLPIVFTAQKDDRFGAGGVFDTTSDGASSQTTRGGEWGGLFFNAGSRASLDNVLITFAGGRIPIEGGFDQFNAVEVHQAEFRLTNSVLEVNASGLAEGDRNGRGDNREAVVFVRGGQPIIVDNIFRNNTLDRVGNPANTAMISINANALQSRVLADYGRSTGPLNVTTDPRTGLPAFTNNHGPLIRRNLIDNNPVNGLEVRGEELTTETIWDDTDIVHVLRRDPNAGPSDPPGQEQIVVNNHHTFSGLRLQSSQNESLVIKVGATDGGFIATGTPLDIDDRIGGTIQVLGFGEFPVIMTSLDDDNFGASFGTDGQPHTDTNNNGNETEPFSGQWRGIFLDTYSNDRNVRVINEVESPVLDNEDINLAPGVAQFLGILAPNEKSGDENRVLGFNINGQIATDDPTDVDVYSFEATPGTEVWIDIDRTGSALDSVVELIASNGNLLARSIDNETRIGSLTVSPENIIEDPFLGTDFYSVNPYDPSMRLRLPGDPSQIGTYFVRVRSNARDASQLNNNIFGGGLTRGEYQLQLRLRQLDEKGGSNIRFANILYPQNGIHIQGLPSHSPLGAEVGERNDIQNNTVSFATADPIGNVLTSDRNTISVAGDLSSPDDVDVFLLEVGYDLVEAIQGVSDVGRFFSAMFDIDYADQLARPDTIISVFDSNRNLILIARDSNILDDQALIGEGNDFDDLTRGSLGELDAFLGPVSLKADVLIALPQGHV